MPSSLKKKVIKTNKKMSVGKTDFELNILILARLARFLCLLREKYKKVMNMRNFRSLHATYLAYLFSVYVVLSVGKFLIVCLGIFVSKLTCSYYVNIIVYD